MWDGGASFPNHGFDFASGDDDPMDEQGHGTSCAGIVAGNGASGSTTGVAPQATVMALRVGGREVNFWRAFEFAIDQGAHVISMSMSWKYPSQPDYPGWRRACETLLVAGILHANSIGNQGDQPAQFPIPYNIATPGNCPPPRLHPAQTIVGGISSAISCGATDDTDRLASYSGRGPAAWEAMPYTDYPYQNGARMGLIKPDVCAPGPGTISCNWLYGIGSTSPYSGFGGTSAATPHVAGCLTLLAHACVRAGQPIVPARIQEALENTAVRIIHQVSDKENHFGAGRVDVYAAYHYGTQRGWW
jgi:subtilisin family serine protease